MNVLSLFDGMSCGQIALERAGIPVTNYFASEVKKSAITLTKHHYPKTIHIGDVTKLSYSDGVLYTEFGVHIVGKIDLIIGGSPCQDFSASRVFKHKTCKKEYGLNGDKSSLFYEYLRILKEVGPKYFLLENVKMKQESKKELDGYLGVESIYINSELFTFQTRPRFYWINCEVEQPKDKSISFQANKDSDFEYCNQFKVNKTPSREKMWNDGLGRTNVKACKNVTDSIKVGCLTRKQDRAPNSGLIKHGDFCRYLTRREMEKAQTVPEGYTDLVSYNQAQDLLGDGWTVDVIAHIFKAMKADMIKNSDDIEFLRNLLLKVA